MANKRKRAPAAPSTDPSQDVLSSPWEGPRAQIVQRQGQDGTSAFDLQIPTDLPPETNIAVDCGIARMRHGEPELVFAQIDPLDDKAMVAVIVVRYTQERFSALASTLESFRINLETQLSAAGARGEPGFFEKLFRSAQPSRPCPKALFDVDMSALTYASGRAAIVSYRVSPHDIQLAIAGQLDHVRIDMPLQVTMSLRAMADLLASWASLKAEVSS